MGFGRQLAEYFYIRKRDPKAPHTQWMGYMHFINRVSLLFAVILLVMLIRIFVFKHHTH